MTEEAAKIVWMSDLHFVAAGMVLNHDPRLRLSAAVDHLNTHHADADLCVISGDLVNRGTLADYTALKACLDKLKTPYHIMVGNHDSRAELQQVFDLPAETMADFVQYAVPHPAARILCLDTLHPGADSGQLCSDRLDWLKATLADAEHKPCLVFMHHPPMALGLPMQDRDRLAQSDSDVLLDLLAAHGGPIHLFIGHVHRATSGIIAGLPFATMRSVLYQAPAPRPAWDWDTFAPASEAPNIGVIYVSGSDFTLHYEQFCAPAYGCTPKTDAPLI